MTSRGLTETNKLRQNVEEQLDRLMQQLTDLEQVREELDEDEYNETKRETLEQLSEFSDSLNRMKEGNMSLIDEFNRIQLAIQAAVSEAFRTPEILQMFAKKQPGQLREKLNQIQRDEKIAKLSHEVAALQTLEILTALRKLGETLRPEEEQFLAANSSNSLKEFQKVDDSEFTGDAKVLQMASSQLGSTTKQ